MKNNRFSRAKTLIHRGITFSLLALLVVGNLLGQVRRDIEVSSYVQPARVSSNPGRSFFRGRAVRFAGAPANRETFPYAGGVVPGRGAVQFWGPANPKREVNPKTMKFVVLDKEKLQNKKIDYDAIGIQWQGNTYRIEMPDDLLLPLMRFVKRDEMIAYTIPFQRYDVDYFKAHALEYFRIKEWKEAGVTKKGDGYIAKEFLTPTANGEIFEKADFAASGALPVDKQRAIAIPNSGAIFDDMLVGDGTYVNADFDVTYQVFLENSGGKHIIDVGGLPLRYHWKIDRIYEMPVMSVWRVDRYTFPEIPHSDQDNSVMMFQTTAILRQFQQTNPVEFRRFMGELLGIVDPQSKPAVIKRPRRGRS